MKFPVGPIVTVLLVCWASQVRAMDIDLSAVPLTQPSQERLTLDALVEGPVILHLWATWCAPCREELPTLDRFSQTLSDPGQLILISVDTTEISEVERFLSDLGIGLYSYQAANSGIGSAFGILGYPSTLVVDELGTIVFRKQGAIDWLDVDVTKPITDFLTPAER